MEVLIILILIVIIVINSSVSRAHRKSVELLQDKVNRLLQETKEIKEEMKNVPAKGWETKPPPVAREKMTPPEPVAKDEVKPSVPTPVATPPPLRKELKEVAPPKYEPLHVVKESWWDGWLRNNPDIEKFIGENLVNKIGIAVLVLGISFFVKYAIDKEWINEAGRVSIGLFCGVILTGLAHYLRNSYRSFSSVLAGGGIAVFYFTIAFAFHQYQLLSQTAAFLVMVVITVFAIALSVLYNKIELAVIAALGGFLTPFMVATGEGNYIVLFTYLIILNSGLLALAFFKRWPLINILALFFTELIFGGWLIKIWWEETTGVSYPLALLFASLLYVQFVGMNMVYQVKYRASFRPLDYSLLILLNGSFFAAGIFLLGRINAGQYQGLFTIAIGAVNYLLARFFLNRQQTDKKLVYLLIGLTLSFLSLAIPIQLKGHAITMFWSVEFVLLLWLYQRSRIRLFYYSSLLVTGLTIISLLMDWANVAATETSMLVLVYANLQGFVTNLVAIASFISYAVSLQKDKDDVPLMKRKTLETAFWFVAFILAYLTAIYSVNLVFRNETNYEVPNVYHRLVTEIAVAAIIFWTTRVKRTLSSWPAASSVLLYLLYHLFSFRLITGLRNGVLVGEHANAHLVFHWVSVGIALFLLYQSIQAIRKTRLQHISTRRMAWIISVVMIIFFSQEAGHLFIAIGYGENNINYLQAHYIKAILTIVWALCSFGLMWLGMRFKNKTLRIISLSLFCLALIKLFFYDIANVSEGGKIAAFILLGILLLTISFMYQKLKKMIIDDSKS